MIRGIRGATTVETDDATEIVSRSYELMKEIVEENRISAEDVTQVLFSATADLNAAFPAKSLRYLDGWKYVPVMCMREIDVPEGLSRCIRVMVTVNTTAEQKEINHIYHHEAIKLRPDLKEEGGAK
ncbi:MULTISPECIES: chorismate mutase [Salimicrobium]|uniref:chorismate mutase n=1 Tax=Salimicrobium humidisoli TaxID=2029857 RepID=A0ABX4HQH0_9BACI|nr:MULTISPECIES: chorismate mutase [Salimicrobium]PBB05461.1 chorismate mutase [Salimicrobium humidisoli]